MAWIWNIVISRIICEAFFDLNCHYKIVPEANWLNFRELYIFIYIIVNIKSYQKQIIYIYIYILRAYLYILNAQEKNC